MVKINFGGSKKAEAPTPDEPPRPAAPGRTPSLKLTVGGSKSAVSTSSPTIAQHPTTPSEPMAKPPPKQKRAYNKKPKVDLDAASPDVSKATKKRPRKDSEVEESAISSKRPQMTRGPSISLKLGNDRASKAPNSRGPKLKIPKFPSKLLLKNSSATTPRLKVKALGKPPVRPRGVGYDSEADGVEVDPAIENQFILRMEPGEDCDYLREAIANSGLKHKGDDKRATGPDIWMRFFDKFGRRGIVSVRGHLYAASLLDLPCVVENMKSWDKRGFFKTADICQILLVLGRVNTEEEAMRMPLPEEVDEKNWQYPHGLTPPMHYVRKRRFRKRINIRTIERVENDVEELFKQDEECKKLKGTIKYEWVEPDQEGGGEGSVIDGYEYTQGNGDQGDDQDAEGEDDVPMAETPMQDAQYEEEDDELTRAFEEEFANSGGDVEMINGAEPGMLQASPDGLQLPENVLTPLSGTTSATEGDEDVSEEEEEEEDAASSPGVVEEVDEEEIARRREREQQMEEIEELRRDVAAAEEKWRTSMNPLLKTRAGNALKVIKADLDQKIAQLGLAEEE
ncbi:hypothetical protein EJ08DRAFT_644957 [Tothia fuscella]|uniref:TAFII55 protein conserved region domain-containing protein n=1 Tax=Tothia fuscella TaxID=1048955 RepID=A0A9P4U552_9PEZI|nr:hypothetical protein EJ08DRAFT_644957 [Tothia fuscella]